MMLMVSRKSADSGERLDDSYAVVVDNGLCYWFDPCASRLQMS